MKRATKLFTLLAGILLFASACAQRTCPTYAENTEVIEQPTEQTV